MSRLLVAIFILGVTAADLAAQTPSSTPDAASMIERARRLVAVDENGCVKYPKDDEIVVCGENPDNKSQRVFRNPDSIDEDRIRPGEAVSQVRAACCSPIPKVPPFYTSSFGNVPPPAIPLEEMLKGLPEPDMIVTSDEPE